MLKINRMLDRAGYASRGAGMVAVILLSVLLSACGSDSSDSGQNSGDGEVTPEQPSDKKPVQLHCAP